MTIKDPKFEISKEIFDKCTKFGNESAPTSTDRYARRNQSDPIKIAKDIRNGKIAEEMVYAKVVELYPNLTLPDFNIYSKKDKSWDPDLRDADSNLRIAVKSQDIESALHYGESWVFQFNPNKNYDTDKSIFQCSDNNYYAAFVLLNIAKKIGEIKAVVKVKWLLSNSLFKEMQKQNLKNNKVAVYYEDLIKYPKSDLWQL